MNALLVDPDSLEALQTLASLRISQCRPSDAATILSPLATRMLTAVRQYNTRCLRDELTTEEDNGTSGVPSPEVCIAFTKLLLEVHEQNVEFAQQAQSILENLLSLDDEQPEAWYLLGMAHLSKYPPDNDAAGEAFDQCLVLLELLGKEAGGDSDALINLREAVTAAMNLKQYNHPENSEGGVGTTRAAALLLNQNSTALMVDVEEEWSTDDDGMDTSS